MLGPNEKEKRSRTDSLFGNVDPLLGKTMGGRWEVQEFLGEGSMSVVYKAQDLETSKPVVLKILHHHLVANAKSLKRFEQRAKATIDLNHERICKVMDIHLLQTGRFFWLSNLLRAKVWKICSPRQDTYQSITLSKFFRSRAKHSNMRTVKMYCTEI